MTLLDARDAPHVCWRGFLDATSASDEGLTTFLQRASGLTLIGEPLENVLFCAHGVGQTGKSTFLDTLAALTYSTNQPDVRVWVTDIRELDAAQVRGDLDLTSGALDLLAGCPPCQGFSRIRTLNRSRDVGVR